MENIEIYKDGAWQEEEMEQAAAPDQEQADSVDGLGRLAVDSREFVIWLGR